jgi:hypothetical protein
VGETATAATLRAMVAFEGGVHRGLSQIGFFVMMHPAAHQFRHLRLYNHIREPETVARFRRFYDWYFHPVDMSGRCSGGASRTCSSTTSYTRESSRSVAGG